LVVADDAARLTGEEITASSEVREVVSFGSVVGNSLALRYPANSARSQGTARKKQASGEDE
jgi:hypothetical protein